MAGGHARITLESPKGRKHSLPALRLSSATGGLPLVGPGRRARTVGAVGDPGETTAGRAAHGPDLELARSTAGEGELGTVRRPGGAVIARGAEGQALGHLGREVQHVDLGVAGGDLLVVREPGAVRREY